MTNQELKEQFDRCQVWQDPEQWEELAMLYYQRGYLLNARRCFELADQARKGSAVTVETAVEQVPA